MGTSLDTPPAAADAARTATDTAFAARGWLVAAAALVVVVLTDVLRVWMPSVVHIFGSAGSTPALRMGAFALLWFLPPFVVALTIRTLGAVRVWRVAVGMLVVARLAQQLADGGTPLLVAACIGVTAGVTAMVALAAGAPSGHLARLGVVLGLAVATVGHAALDTVDLTWRPGWGVSVAVVAVLVVTFVVADRAARVALWWPTTSASDGASAPVWTRGSSWAWVPIGPAMVLVGIVVAAPARLELAAGMSARTAVLALAVAAGLAVVAASLSTGFGSQPLGVIGAVGTLSAALLALRPVGTVAAVAQLALLVAIGAAIGAPGTTPRDSGPRRRAAAAATSMLLFFVFGFLYYASYDIRLVLSNRVVLVVAAAVIAAASAWAARAGRSVKHDGVVRKRLITGVVTGAIVVGFLGGAALPDPAPAPTTTATSGQIRIAAFNVHMGYDLDGRFDPGAIAAVLAAEDADIVVLNEVDRGWLLNGGHDVLRLLAADLGLPEVVFAPAADELWGNAVLSRFPLRHARVERLPRGGAPMARSLVSVVADVSETRSLGIVGTHLHHVTAQPSIRLAQARAVAAEVSRLESRGLPVVVLGDLNAAVDAPELQPLDFLTTAIPAGIATYPADDPVERLDHILVTPNLRYEGATIPDVTVSDHLPVFVTLHVPTTGTSP